MREGREWMYGCKRERYVGRERERGKTWSSKRQSSIPRRCTQPFAYESGSEERTEGPEACMWRL